MDPPASHSAKGNPSGPFVEGAPDTKQEVVDKDHIEIFRIKVKKFMNTTSFGRAYADALMVLSVLSCFLFIYLTYGHEDLVMFDIIEMALASLFSFDWLLSFFIADHRVEFVNSFFSMVDLLTVIPIWITFNSKQVTYPEVKSFHDMFLYFLFGLNTTRILRALRIHKKLMFVEDEVARALGNIILTVVVMLLFGSAVMQYLEEHEQHLPFHTWMYAVWVTVSTVGFGDISPSSPLGRMAVMIIIGFAVIQVPKMTNDLLAKMALTSVYARVVYIPKKNSTHVIVCGDLASTSMREFFVELFHEDHEAGNTMALILQPRKCLYMIASHSMCGV